MLIRLWLLPVLITLFVACSSTRDASVPSTSGAAESDRTEPQTMFVAVDALNLRVSPAGDGRIVAKLERGTAVAVLAAIDGWTEVRSGSLRGWVASRYLTKTGNLVVSRSPRSGVARKDCPADRSFRFSRPPRLAFSQDGAHGLVVIEASVNAAGIVTSTRVLSNDTGRSELARAAEKELSDARFDPPIRNCRPAEFIYTYKRVF